MHEWDVAASNPCPFCRELEVCPRAQEPSDRCLEFWPLGQPRHRELNDEDRDGQRWKRIALGNGEVRSIVEQWQSGAQVQDDQYLCLRSLINEAPTDDAADGYWYVLLEMLTPKAFRYIEDALQHYGIGEPSDRFLAAASALLRGSVIVARESLVTGDTSVPVPSHFERIVFEGFKTFLFALARMPFLKLPRDDDDALKQGVEEEWRRVLRYGNGFHGFTVYPRIRIEDLVRYQQLGGGDDLVSWSISNWVIWSMTAFPHPAQTRAPRFGERVFGDRLVRMYEPLVQSYATKIRRRLRGSEKDQPLPPKREVAIALRALLRKLIDEYDFMHGKPKDAVLSSVGAIGSESSAGWRDELEGRFAEFGLPFRAQDVVHVGFARYVVTKFQEHLREH